MKQFFFHDTIFFSKHPIFHDVERFFSKNQKYKIYLDYFDEKVSKKNKKKHNVAGKGLK